MALKKQPSETWKRPEDIETFRTSDPKEMLGRYLPKQVIKTWTEDFRDGSTGETVSIERNQILMDRGYITKDKVSEILFFIQSGDIKDVEVCNHDIGEMKLYTHAYFCVYNVEFRQLNCDDYNHYVVQAQNIPQAIRIATEFGQVYRGVQGDVIVTKVVNLAIIPVPDNHPCIPESDQTPAYERKDYFKVQVRTEWVDDMKWKKSDAYYVVAANDVGEAKERIALLLEIRKAEADKKGDFVIIDPTARTTIRKAVPFEVNCIVPKEFSELYIEKAI